MNCDWTRALWKRTGRQFHSTGLLVGTAFFAMSLTPSLLPRTSAVQGFISGLSMAAGYALGVMLYLLWRYLGLPVPRGRMRLVLHMGAGTVSLLFALVFLWRASDWQNSLRLLMNMDPISGPQLTLLGLVALLVFVGAVFLARLFRITFRFIAHRLSRYVPHRASIVAGLLSAVVIFWAVVDGILFRFALEATDRSYREINALIEPEIGAPDRLTEAGDGQLLPDWQALGRHGRRYLSSVPDAEHIAEFTDRETMTPLRVYVGLGSAETADERAELALAELLRRDAFAREALIIVTPTGTGWVDPASIETVEYLFQGDIASVAAQYSYLPSPVSLLSEAEYGVDMARSLFQSVYGHWRTLPRQERPKLFLLGLSLGALNSDLSFDFYDIIDDPFDGALWSGPPFRSETWREVTRRRVPGSPVWRPLFRDGSVVRFANQHGGLDVPDAPWGRFRIAFLQYASDPVTFFDPRAYFREPDWMKEPRAFDVSPELRWFPVVTMLQLAADLAFGSSPTGYGHNYAPEDYHDTWLALAQPQGWTEAQLERLRQMHQRKRLTEPQD